MGSGRRSTIVLQEELEQTERRRRSSRIIALESKREIEKNNKELERKNDSSNAENRDEGKEKEITAIDDYFVSNYDEDDELHSPTNKKRRKYKELHQLILSNQPMQEAQYQPERGSTSRTNVSSLNVMPEKHVLEFVLNVLQRNDPEEFFAEPVSPNVEDYYRIIKKPVDFGTMRAKLHENMYTSMEEFKLDVYLLCANAMNVNPANTRRYQVAKAIQSLSRTVFEDLSAAGLQRFKLESFPIERPPAAPSRKPQRGQPRTIGHARFRRKPAGTYSNNQNPPASTPYHHFSKPSLDQPPSVSDFNDSKSDSLFDPRALIHSRMNSPPGICFSPSQAANFSRRANPHTSHQVRDFQGVLSPTMNHFNNSSCQSHEQVLNQASQCSTPLITFDYTHLQVQLGLKNPMGPFPMLHPKSSLASSEMRTNMDQPQEKEGECKSPASFR